MRIELHQFAKLYATEENDIPVILGITCGKSVYTKRLCHVSDILALDNHNAKLLVDDFYVLNNHLMISCKEG